MKKYILTLIFLLPSTVFSAIPGYSLSKTGQCLLVEDNADFFELQHCEIFMSAKINNNNSRKVEISETDPRGVFITKGPEFMENNYYGDMYGWAYLAYDTLNRTSPDFNSPIFDSNCRFNNKVDNQGNLKDLDTKVFIKGIEKNTFNYKKQTNQTIIKTKDRETNQTTTTTRTGFVPVTIITNKDNLLEVSY